MLRTILLVTAATLAACGGGSDIHEHVTCGASWQGQGPAVDDRSICEKPCAEKRPLANDGNAPTCLAPYTPHDGTDQIATCSAESELEVDGVRGCCVKYGTLAQGYASFYFAECE